MELSATVFLGLLACVAVLRGVELQISHRHQRALRRRGATEPPDRAFRVMVLLHAGVLVGAAVEVVVLHRPFIAVLAISAGAVFVAANVIRWWVILTLGEHWNVRVVDSTKFGVVANGPFRFVRHPNYAAVFLELAALPLIHTAWLTALVGSSVHMWVLARRVALEERVLFGNPQYRATMGDKPRFVPRLPSHEGQNRNVY